MPCLQGKTLEWAEYTPSCLLHGAFEGLKKSGITKHLVVDEMRIIRRCSTRCFEPDVPYARKQLGDFGRSLNPNHRYTLDDLKEGLSEIRVCELNKATVPPMRSSPLQKRVQNVDSLEPVSGHGEEVALISLQKQGTSVPECKAGH